MELTTILIARSDLEMAGPDMVHQFENFYTLLVVATDKDTVFFLRGTLLRVSLLRGRDFDAVGYVCGAADVH
jgi:hypothetical protein